MAFDWEKEGPSVKALEVFTLIKDESEFPDTYSGQSWRAAYRIWNAVKAEPSVLEKVGPYDSVPGADCDDLDLTGFMYGWAVNAVRQMLGMRPGANGAIVTLGVGAETYPSVGPAEKAMRRAIGGDEE